MELRPEKVRSLRGIWVVSGCPWVAAWSVENKFVQCGPAAPRREGCHRSDPSTPRSGAALCHQAGEAHLPPEHLPAPRLRPLLCVHTPEPLSRLSPRLLWALGWWVLCFTPVSVPCLRLCLQDCGALGSFRSTPRTEPVLGSSLVVGVVHIRHWERKAWCHGWLTPLGPAVTRPMAGGLDGRAVFSQRRRRAVRIEVPADALSGDESSQSGDSHLPAASSVARREQTPVSPHKGAPPIRRALSS